jgi:DNA polymerase-1
MKLAELLQKYLGQTTPIDCVQNELNKINEPTYVSLLVPKDEACDRTKEVPSATLNAQELLNREGVTRHYITNLDQIAEALKELMGSDVTLGLDIETAKLPPHEQQEKAGLDPHLSRIRLLQVGTKKAVYIFDIDATGIEPLQPLWGLPMVAHNAVFEMKHLIHAGVNLQDIDCTMLMDNALTANLHSLADMAQDYLGWNISKDQQVSDWNAPILSQDQLAYAALDAFVVFRLYEILHKKLIKKERFAVYALMRNAQKAIAKLELNGSYFLKILTPQHYQAGRGLKKAN